MLEIAIDVGGTFTDVVCLHDQQRLLLVKVPTTSDDLVQGVRQGVARVLELAEQPTTVVERFIHSTTIATHAILEQKGAITGVLMTAGFEDVLEIGRQKRSNMYDLFLDPETPIFLALRRQRVGIRERLDAAGNILQPLDAQQVVQTVATLQQFYGVQSVQAPSSSLQAARKGTRLAYFDEYQTYRDTPIYRRDLLPLGAQFDGPAIVEQPDTTTVVYPGFTCRIDDAGNLLLTLFTR
jgi:N-methylhydantoinase A/oxoprolinase/acetone carboxylase beta subunit